MVGCDDELRLSICGTCCCRSYYDFMSSLKSLVSIFSTVDQSDSLMLFLMEGTGALCPYHSSGGGSSLDGWGCHAMHCPGHSSFFRLWRGTH